MARIKQATGVSAKNGKKRVVRNTRNISQKEKQVLTENKQDMIEFQQPPPQKVGWDKINPPKRKRKDLDEERKSNKSLKMFFASSTESSVKRSVQKLGNDSNQGK